MNRPGFRGLRALLKWVQHHEIDNGTHAGVVTEECERIKMLEREVKNSDRSVGASPPRFGGACGS